MCGAASAEKLFDSIHLRIIESLAATDAPWEEEFASDGATLVVEQAIAARAAIFLGSGRSAVTQFVVQMRRSYGRPATTFINL